MAINLVAVTRHTTTRKMAVLLIMTPATIEWNKIAIPQPFRLFSFRFAGISHGLDPKFHPSRHRNGATACLSGIRGGIEIQLTNSELMLNPKGEQQVDYPTLFWHVHGANFAVIRSGLNRFPASFFILHTTSTALAEKNMIRSKSVSPPYCRYSQSMNKTMTNLDSNANLAADQFSIDTGVENSSLPRESVT